MTFDFPKISKILSSSCGVKCLLFDAFTKSNLSCLIPHSVLLDNDFFLFDDIENSRTKININCVCVININSFRNLIKEISDPCFRSYSILFTNYIDPFLLDLLAKNDIYGVIEDIHEIYMDFNKQDYNLFTINKLSDFLYSLGIQPTIYNYKNNKSTNLYKHDCVTNLDEGGQVFILDRLYDQITPLIIDWHYQSMIKKYCVYDNYIVTINNTKYNINDDFFDKNKFKDISEVSKNLEILVNELEVKKKIKKVSIHEIEEINKLNEMVTKHFKIYNFIINNLEEKRKQSEEEMTILKNYKNNIFREDHKNNIVKEDHKNSFINLYKLLNDKNYKHKFEIKKHEDIKLAYVPPIKKIIKNIMRKNYKDWECIQEKSKKDLYTIFYFKGGLTYTEYRFIMEHFRFNTSVYVISEKILN